MFIVNSDLEFLGLSKNNFSACSPSLLGLKSFLFERQSFLFCHLKLFRHFVFSIYCNELMIGTSNFSGFDAGMGVATGSFFPNENYESVRGHFRLFTKATFDEKNIDEAILRAFYARNATYRFTVLAPDKTPVPVSTCLVRDYSVELPELELDVYQVEIQISEQNAWFHGSS